MTLVFYFHYCNVHVDELVWYLLMKGHLNILSLLTHLSVLSTLSTIFTSPLVFTSGLVWVPLTLTDTSLMSTFQGSTMHNMDVTVHVWITSIYYFHLFGMYNFMLESLLRMWASIWFEWFKRLIHVHVYECT